MWFPNCANFSELLLIARSIMVATDTLDKGGIHDDLAASSQLKKPCG